MNDKTLHERLDEEMNFIKKLRLAVAEGELVYWSNRSAPPNLEEQEFRTYCFKIRPPLEPEWVQRLSSAGKYGQTGEEVCFQFEKQIGFLGKIKNYYVKGFFFEKGNLKGVAIQSFREVKRHL
jgi:hypothetical protein